MKRRIALVALTFLVLLLLYVVYYQASQSGDIAPWRYSRRDPGSGQATTLALAKGLQLEHDTSVPAFPPVLLYYDKDHNLSTKFTADRWEKQEDSFFFPKPRMEWYRKDGQKITLTADKGYAQPREINGQTVIRSGKLKDNVWIVMDRGTDPRRAPLEERPEDAVRIHVDYIEFDQDRLCIQTDSDVEMHAREADIFGKGLWVSWSEAPAMMLREMRIERGDRMIIRQGQDQLLKQIALPGLGSSGAAGTEAVVAAAKPSSSPSSSKTPSTAASPAGELTARGGGRTAALSDAYTAEFIGNVEANAGTQYLHGADVLQLTFDVKQGLNQRRPAVSQAASTRPAARASTATSSASESTPLVLTWKGPLVLRPVPATESQPAKKLDVAARGQRMEMADGRTKAICKSFEYDSAQERGSLVGTDDEPAQLEVATNDSTPDQLRMQKFKARVLRFQRDVQKREIVVNLEGAGSMYLPGKPQAQAADIRKDRDFSGQETNIQWSRQVEARFGQRETAQRGKKEDYLRQAHFTGDVDIRIGQTQSIKAQQLDLFCIEPRGPADPVNLAAKLHAEGDVDFQDTKTGDFIRAQKVDLEMFTESGPRNQPRHAWASGSVKARQNNSDIAGDSLDLTFTLLPDDASAQVRAKPDRLMAEGNVHVDDHSSGNPANRLVADADKIVAHVQEKSVTLTGNPAKATQNERSMEGQTITVEGKKDLASVPGPGRLSVYSEVDFSGAHLREPMLITVDWSKSLIYNGKQRNCVVDGDVDVKGPEDRIRCDTATLIFSEASKDKNPASQPTTKRVVQVGKISPQDLAMVLAKGKKVLMEREKRDADGFLLEATQLQTTSITYVVETHKVICDSPGYAIMANYRPAETVQPADDASGGAMPTDFVQRPFQATFSWVQQMAMVQGETGMGVDLQGGVRMRYATGNEVLLGGRGIEPRSVRELKEIGLLEKYLVGSGIRLPEKLPNGEFMLVNCDELFVQFGKRDQKKAVESEDGGPTFIGPVDRVDARGYQNAVSFEDRPRRVTVGAKSILYQSSMGVAIIVGSLPNEPPRLAQVSYVDKQTGALQTKTAQRILWYPKLDKVTIEKAEGHGSR